MAPARIKGKRINRGRNGGYGQQCQERGQSCDSDRAPLTHHIRDHPHSRKRVVSDDEAFIPLARGPDGGERGGRGATFTLWLPPADGAAAPG